MNLKLKRFLKWTALVLAALAVASLATCGWVNWQTDGEIRREIARLREAGESVDPLELAPPPLPEEENAAPRIMAALALLKNDGTDDIAVERLDDEASAPEIRRLVERYAPALADLHEALKNPRCRFDTRYEEGFSARLPHVIEALKGSRLLALESTDRRRRGDVAGAADSAVAMLRLSRAVQTDHILVSQLVAHVILDQAIGRLQGLAFTEVQERDLLALADPAEARRALRRTWRMERAIGLDAFRSLADGSLSLDRVAGTHGPPTPPAWLTRLSVVRPFLLRDQLAYLKMMDKVVKAFDPEAPAGADYESMLAGMETEAPSFPGLTRLLIPAFSKVLVRGRHVDIRCAQLRAVAALIRSAGKPGPLPLDPYTDRPMAFRKDAGGFALWSVGEDRVDDGGHKERDIVWVHKN